MKRILIYWVFEENTDILSMFHILKHEWAVLTDNLFPLSAVFIIKYRYKYKVYKIMTKSQITINIRLYE